MTTTTSGQLTADINEGRRVLQEEGQALLKLADMLGDSFHQAIETLTNVRGRVVTTGMGKSGIIAHKLAATLSSTGTPALFVHPAEANHGDLGMMTSADCVIAFSASGKSEEMSGIYNYCRRFAIPLVGITQDPESLMGRAANILIQLPKLPEACPLSLAPMTSTTMMLALGDALAAAIMRRKGFSSDQFRDFHPGGKLGRQLLQVKDIMHTGVEVPLAPSHILVRDCVSIMTDKKFGAVGITNDKGDLVGILTDGDLRRQLKADADILEKPVNALMVKNPKRVRLDAFLADAAHLMATYSIPSVFVTDGERPIGIIHLHDILKVGFI